jgi:hypothetical protein
MFNRILKAAVCTALVALVVTAGSAGTKRNAFTQRRGDRPTYV